MEYDAPRKNNCQGLTGHQRCSRDHRDVIRLKRVAKLATGHTPRRQHPEYWVNCTIPWFSLADVWRIRDGELEYLGDTAEKISELGVANSAACLLPAGTVIVSRTASVGLSGILPVPIATTQDSLLDLWSADPDGILAVRLPQHEKRISAADNGLNPQDDLPARHLGVHDAAAASRRPTRDRGEDPSAMMGSAPELERDAPGTLGANHAEGGVPCQREALN